MRPPTSHGPPAAPGRSSSARYPLSSPNGRLSLSGLDVSWLRAVVRSFSRGLTLLNLPVSTLGGVLIWQSSSFDAQICPARDCERWITRTLLTPTVTSSSSEAGQPAWANSSLRISRGSAALHHPAREAWCRKSPGAVCMAAAGNASHGGQNWGDGRFPGRPAKTSLWCGRCRHQAPWPKQFTPPEKVGSSRAQAGTRGRTPSRAGGMGRGCSAALEMRAGLFRRVGHTAAVSAAGNRRGGRVRNVERDTDGERTVGGSKSLQ
jgi:hypothetical protein